MMGSWRLPVAAAALTLTVAAGAATAQSVIVSRAPAGARVELALNSTVIGTSTVGADGRATLAVNLAANSTKTETDVAVFVEACEGLRRVILVEPGMQPLPVGECPRREAPGLYILRKITTLVVDVSDPAPSALVRQGEAPIDWFSADADRPTSSRPVFEHAKGLVVFGGGGGASFGNAAAVACGGLDCAGRTKPLAFSAGATFWLTPFLAMEGSFLKPDNITLRGGSDLYRYISTLNTNVITMVGKFGIPVTHVRIYGFGGGTFSWASWNTTQIVQDQSFSIDGVETVIPGGTQTLTLRTEGWGWVAGGGFEMPISRRYAFYSEAGRAVVKGTNRDGGEGEMNETILYFFAGLRMKIGK